MAALVLHGLIQKTLKAPDELKARMTIGADGTVWKNTEAGWRSVGVIKDPELAEDLKLSQLCQEDR